ncbi:hypothetical protein ACLM5J_02550 [Nocardioides sp. Bht2]|uniref:hypothetical protein n=1 Tax=Nocardioides sp. Bht2 TaxID=3392297 RepID=UPI0039B3CC8C
MRKRIFTAAALSLALTPMLTATISSAAGPGEWQDGTSSSDTVISCPTQTAGIGTSANVGWRSPTGQVPKVGEKFYLRGYIGLISLPCSGKVATIPEILAPPGVEFVDEPVQWAVYKAAEGGTLGTGGLDFFNGVNGGYVITQTGDEPFILRQGEIFEFQFPVKATRPLKGTATPAPTCLSRRDGSKPCPVASSGDHLQIAFAVGGHGGDKSYVTPYVPLFAAGAGDSGGPVSISGGPREDSVVTASSATFSLSAPGNPSCTLDGRPKPCSNGRLTLSGLAPGTHVFTAKSGQHSETRTWTVPHAARSFKRAGKWSLSRSAAAYGGQVLTSRKKGATLSLNVRGAKRLSLVAGKSRGHGTVKVYAGSRLLKTVKLSAGRTLAKQVISLGSLGSSWTGKVRVVVASNGKPVKLEGLGVVTR